MCLIWMNCSPPASRDFVIDQVPPTNSETTMKLESRFLRFVKRRRHRDAHEYPCERLEQSARSGCESRDFLYPDCRCDDYRNHQKPTPSTQLLSLQKAKAELFSLKTLNLCQQSLAGFFGQKAFSSATSRLGSSRGPSLNSLVLALVMASLF
jgi:hypothetical protein